MSESIRENAWRHLRNAGRYAAAGNIEFADGSAEKANRNFRKANELTLPDWLLSIERSFKV